MKRLSSYFSLIVLFIFIYQQSIWAFDDERFAIIIGNNYGALQDIPLRYAENDAKSIYDVLTQLGGFNTSNTKLLIGKDIATLRQELEKFSKEIKKHKNYDFLLYYSGHSNSQGLQIRDQILSAQELKNYIRNSGGQIKIAIIDGCNSGTIVASKGGQTTVPFEIDLDQMSNVEGEIFISSSTALEKSLESSEIQGSFFTHFLVTALRGDADFNSDGRISLSEAYRYAYDHTVLKTASLNLGSQHPTYQFKLFGKGEYFLSSLSDKLAYLVFPPQDSGKFFVYNSKGGYIISEVEKNRGDNKKIALAGGSYIIRKYDKGKLQQQEIKLAPQQSQSLDWEKSSLLATANNQENMATNIREISYFLPNQKKSNKRLSLLKKVPIQKGEMIRLKLLEDLNSKSAHVGDKVIFETSEDTYVNGQLVIASGSPALGEVIFAKSRKGLARGELALALRYVKAIDGQNIPIASVIAEQGKGKFDDPNFAEYSQHYRNTGHTFFEDSFRYNINPYKQEEYPTAEVISRFVSLGLAVGISAALWGKNAKMQAGTIITGFVDETKEINLP